MMTPTHLVVGIAAFSRPGQRLRNIAAAFGALLPDLSIYILFVWARLLAGISERELWSRVYWQEPWQSLSAISNSIPLYLLLLGIGIWLRRDWLWALAGAALLHVSLDFPFHVQDAHVHFWPFSDWRFNSPFSYWDNAHYARYVRVLELAIATSCMLWIWVRYQRQWVRIAIGLALASYVAVPLYFSLAHH